MGNVTIKDIAKKAGVSHQTVSKILHNRPSFVGEETKKKVLEITRELNYRPNFFARQLKGARTNTIGLLGTKTRFHFSSYTFSKVAEGVEQGLSDTGTDQSLLIFASSFENTYKKSLELIENGLVDGLVLIILSRYLKEFEQDLLPRLQAANLPFVAVHSMNREMSYPNVGVSSYKAGYLAGERFASLGYDNLAYNKWWKDDHIHCIESEQGFLDACGKAGISPDSVTVLKSRGNTFEGAYKYYMELKEIPRAIYFRPDAAAYGALKALRERGLRVPEDVAIIGTNDENPAEYFETDLTTVTHPYKEKGVAAAKMLSGLMDGSLDKNEPHSKILDVELVIRKTCGK